MKSIQAILSQFDAVSLTDMEGVKLMDRRDLKFTFCSEVLQPMLQKLHAHYFVLQIENKRMATYNTLYFDTPGMAMYTKHHNGALNRHKIRYRTYADSDLSFLEIKFKNNKGRTIKNRIKVNALPKSWDERTSKFIAQYSPYCSEELSPVLWVNYKRITLVSKMFNERLTVDLELEFRRGDRHVRMHDLVIAEVKQSGRSRTQAMQVFKKYKVKPVSLSKYCLAVATVLNDVKKNNFKEKLTYLNKLMYDNSIQYVAGNG